MQQQMTRPQTANNQAPTQAPTQASTQTSEPNQYIKVLRSFYSMMTNVFTRQAVAIEKQTMALERIASALEKMLPEGAEERESAPNYKYTLEEFPGFDWNSINAQVVSSEASEKDGTILAKAVRWNGEIFVRRSPQNKYAPVVFFSRGCGKNPDGTTKYVRLVTFKALSQIEPEPISRKAADYLQ